MKNFTILYGSTKTEVITADSLNKAELSAHKEAKEKKTIVIRVKEVIEPEN